MTHLVVHVAPWPPSCRRESIPPPGQLMTPLVVHVAPGLHPAGGQRGPHHQTSGVARLDDSTSYIGNVVIIRTRVRIMGHDPDPDPGGKNL